jgi:phytoene dehydrogenase-like protein
MPLRPYRGWPSLKPEATDRVIARASEFVDGLVELSIEEASETPDEMAERVHATHGCLWHVDLSVWRMGPLRPARGLSGYRTPIPGYYLGGAGSHPMPGMSSLPGRLASQQIIADGDRRLGRPNRARRVVPIPGSASRLTLSRR